MNTYEFEYDTLCHENLVIKYQASSLHEAILKFKKNHKNYVVLSVKENKHCLSWLCKQLGYTPHW